MVLFVSKFEKHLWFAETGNHQSNPMFFLSNTLVNPNLLMTLLVFTGEALQGSYHVAFAQSQEPENLRSAVLGLVRNARGPMALKSLGAEGQEVASLG